MVGLTGGVGAGKSTVTALLAKHGAMIIDADAIAREVVEPGSRCFDAVVARFGREVVADDGTLDRAAIAALVFSDAGARADLNAIIHPVVAARSGEMMAAAAEHSIIVYDVPLLVESGVATAFDRVVVVEADTAIRLARLADRGMTEQDAMARMAAQATDDERRAVADEVIVNNGTRAALATAVSELWQRLSTPRAPPDSGRS